MYSLYVQTLRTSFRSAALGVGLEVALCRAVYVYSGLLITWCKAGSDPKHFFGRALRRAKVPTSCKGLPIVPLVHVHTSR